MYYKTSHGADAIKTSKQSINLRTEEYKNDYLRTHKLF